MTRRTLTSNNYCIAVNLRPTVQGLLSPPVPGVAMSTADAPAPVVHRPRATEVEQHGIDTIPPEHRHSGPLDLFRIQFGGANTFATVILGTFPILLGLSLWQAVGATVLGVLVGALILMPMGLFGPLTGTNNAVSS